MFCRKLMNDKDKGDDLWHDALVAGLTRFDQLDSRDSFMPWLYRIIINRFKSSARKAKLRSFLPIGSSTESELPITDTSEQLTAKLQLDRLLNTLAPDDRALVVLHEIDGWPLNELTDMFNKSENTLGVRLHRAREKMKQAVKKMSAQNSLSTKLLGEINEKYAL